MTAAPLDRPSVAALGHATTSSYTELARSIRGSGLMRRRYGYYWTSIALAILAFFGLWAVFFVIGESWLQLIVAGALGVLVTQFGFLGHDAAHRQIFASAGWNDWTARAMSGLFAGLSFGWWRGKHNMHHAHPNQEGRDPDIAPGALAFTRDIAAERTAGAKGWFQRHQGWLFFPLLTLEGLNLHIASLRLLFESPAMAFRRTEAALIVTRLSAYVVILLIVLPIGMAAAFFFVQMAVFGLCLGGSFAPNHKGMPIVPKDSKIDFLQRQVLMSRNVRGGPFVDVAMGGLNYQIEHHLFPSMPRPNLKRAQPLIRAYCASREVPYVEVGLFRSYGIVVRYLNNVGLQARGPFECPLASQLRD